MSETKNIVIGNMQPRADLPLQLLLADIDEVLTAHRASVGDLLVVARQLMVSAVGQLAGQGTVRRADLETLCHQTAQTVLQAMLQRINAKNMTQGEA